MIHFLRRPAVFGLAALMALLFMTVPTAGNQPSVANAAAGEVLILSNSGATNVATHFATGGQDTCHC